MHDNRNWHVVAKGAEGQIVYKSIIAASERGARAMLDKKIVSERTWFDIELRAAPEPGRLWQEMPIIYERHFGDRP